MPKSLWSIHQNVKRTAQFVAEFHYDMHDLTNGQWANGRWVNALVTVNRDAKLILPAHSTLSANRLWIKKRRKMKRREKMLKKGKKIRRKFHRNIQMHLRLFMKGDNRTFFKPQNIPIKNVFRHTRERKKTTMWLVELWHSEQAQWK